MSNLKQLFYREYYPGLPNLLAKDGNEVHFKTKNKSLTDYTFKKTPSDLLNLSSHNLGVTNFQLLTTYPGLFTGSGYTHETGSVGEVKIGFFFDHTTGLPILPGSSVKGTLRSAFPDTKSKGKPETELDKSKSDWVSSIFFGGSGHHEEVFWLAKIIFEGLDYPKTQDERVKKNDAKLEEQLPMKERCVFLDAFISKGSESKGGKILGMDTLTPHGDNPLKNPVPLPFIKVLPNVEWTFQFVLHDIEIGENKISSEKLLGGFKEILETLGLGAKTNVGYGQFANDKQEDGPVQSNRASAAMPFIGEIRANRDIENIQGEVVSVTSDKRYVSFVINEKEYEGKELLGKPNLEVGNIVNLKISFNATKEPSEIKFTSILTKS